MRFARTLFLPAVALATLTTLLGCTFARSDPVPTSLATPGANNALLHSYLPVAAGNTWVYAVTTPLGSLTQTETMSTVAADGDTLKVTMTRTFDYTGEWREDDSDSVEYVFHPDGSVSVPHDSEPDWSTTVTSGDIRWPSSTDLWTGEEVTGVAEVTMTNGRSEFDARVQYTFAGAGEEEVSVPFGTVTARKLTFWRWLYGPTIDSIPIHGASWFAQGIGLVRTEWSVADPDVGPSQPAYVWQLLRFNPA